MTLNNSVGHINPQKEAINVQSSTPANMNRSAFFSMGDDSVILGPSTSNNINSYTATGQPNFMIPSQGGNILLQNLNNNSTSPPIYDELTR